MVLIKYSAIERYLKMHEQIFCSLFLEAGMDLWYCTVFPIISLRKRLVTCEIRSILGTGIVMEWIKLVSQGSTMCVCARVPLFSCKVVCPFHTFWSSAQQSVTTCCAREWRHNGGASGNEGCRSKAIPPCEPWHHPQSDCRPTRDAHRSLKRQMKSPSDASIQLSFILEIFKRTTVSFVSLVGAVRDSVTFWI